MKGFMVAAKLVALCGSVKINLAKFFRHLRSCFRNYLEDAGVIIAADFTAPNFRQCFKINWLANNNGELCYDMVRHNRQRQRGMA